MKNIFIIFILIFSLISPSYAISISEEKKIAKEFLIQIEKKNNIIDDFIICKYYKGLAHRLLSFYPDRIFKYNFYILNNINYNAFAAPAGNIFINTGLLEIMENEDEIAGILAHEIAHSNLRHLSKTIEKNKKVNIGAVAGLAAGILLGLGGATAASNTAIFSSIIGSQSLYLAYSRDFEREADKTSIKYLNLAGYNPNFAISMLEKIRNRQWIDSNDIPIYLQTHPKIEERISYLKDLIKKYNFSKNQKGRKSFYFKLFKTRLIALYSNEEIALKKFQNKQDSFSYYGRAIVLRRLRNFDLSEKNLKIAEKDIRFRDYALREFGMLYFRKGDYDKALKYLKEAKKTKLLNKDLEIDFFIGKTYIEKLKYNKAIEIFLRLLDEYDEAYFELATAYGRNNELGLAHYYLGIYYKNLKNHQKAVFHFKKSIKDLKDSEKINSAKDFLEILK